MATSYLKNQYRSFQPGKNLPKISTSLDSVRAYQFEVRFFNLPNITEGVNRLDQDTVNTITTAAKQVSPIGGSVDDIVVDRLNDKVYYPGKFTPESVTITFDNQLLSKTTPALWEFFKTIYDPITGDLTKLTRPGGSGGSFKLDKVEIYEFDNTNDLHAAIGLFGVYPTGVRFSEKNYSTNDFSTVEVTFRYDFVDYQKSIEF
tara:strand:+ start:391 stop:999 length:609 start_codon:yes stop_codon:yes gene_type:complete